MVAHILGFVQLVGFFLYYRSQNAAAEKARDLEEILPFHPQSQRLVVIAIGALLGLGVSKFFLAPGDAVSGWFKAPIWRVFAGVFLLILAVKVHRTIGDPSDRRTPYREYLQIVALIVVIGIVMLTSANVWGTLQTLNAVHVLSAWTFAVTFNLARFGHIPTTLQLRPTISHELRAYVVRFWVFALLSTVANLTYNLAIEELSVVVVGDVVSLGLGLVLLGLVSAKAEPKQT